MEEVNRRANMYGRETMNAALHHQDTHQIDDDDNDDVAGGGATAGGGGGGGDNPTPHIRYDQHHSHSQALHNGASMEAAMNGVDNALYCPPSEIVPTATVGSGASDQLTLSFQGEASGDFPGRLNKPQRAASLNRFREKRKERCFDKKIRYTVRKEVAMRMQRKKGQFTSAKSISDEAGSSSADWNEGSGQEEQETSCRHCGISSKSTPMMRRGPAGPRSLCNACGLKWANKGILRDLSKVPTPGAQDQIAKSGEQINGEPNGSDVMAAAAIITPDVANTMVTAER
ncbi:hypothetical protein RND71_000422 [Anisodus tanguticus]|uniref:CCT domain-containing protein n=1 Tax=Anisodus tanguticus TaxID=243964 RepID=A0AAE1SZF7_9SOLA|nr:hypothetical protein RND71_000422 [Anisodus tanguticus]